MGKKVFQIETISFYPLTKNSKSNQIHAKDREGQILELQKQLQNKHLYYADDYDMTLNLQKYVERKGIKFPLQPFWWNESFCQQFLNSD